MFVMKVVVWCSWLIRLLWKLEWLYIFVKVNGCRVCSISVYRLSVSILGSFVCMC